MPCGVISCSINDDRFLWKCEFCNKKYHAACVGVQRQREHFISAFMVPMCADCQPTLRKEVDVRKLLYQQEQLVDAIHSQTDTNHRIAADLKKFCLVSELFDSIEHLLNDVKETLANVNKNNSNMCSAVGKHMKAYDSQLNMTMTHINESNSTTSANIIKHLDERLNCLRNDLATPMKEAEQEIPQGTDSSILHILEEVKLVKNNNNINSNYNTNNKSNNNIKHNVTHINNRNNNNNNNSNRNKNHRNSNNHPQLPLDKNLLAMAKTQFSGPPSSIEHPIAAFQRPHQKHGSSASKKERQSTQITLTS
ncbi:glycosyltransferase-like protein gnt13 [Uranotaenia lowii]|uniref:glycosyltransferase-like protein gnt13 n=1 Tax=Uranotaenia lowii TaxID=190385 RepID=UPI0024784E2A|nr:glycosyltransferase-like protein gnt13 [Uranotaenia lowii]